MVPNSNELALAYEEIIDDVINEVQHMFLEENIAEPVLNNLREMWKEKLLNCQTHNFDKRKHNLEKQNTCNQFDDAVQVTDSGGCDLEAIGQKDGVSDFSECNTSDDDNELGEKENYSSSTPLNSEDDISDEEDTDTDNIILCQYQNILRRSNKWKFVFISGVMKLNGQEYIFKSLNGDGTW